MNRCAWVGSDELYQEYHDHEWGVPVHDDRLLFEMLILEGAQAVLSWRTILGKRGGYREAFCDFDLEHLARLGQSDLERLLQNPGIVRNRLKLESTITNARAAIAVIEERGSLDSLIWSYVDGAHPARCLRCEHGLEHIEDR